MDNYGLIPIQNLKNLTFKVEKYQRGYKWGMLEVEYLLKDIYEFDKSKQAFYCLQPVVVKEIKAGNKRVYELIDGQQRLTTVYIILQCLNSDHIFNIDYNTRKRSAEFLKNIKKIEVLQLSNIKQDEINRAWSTYISNYPENDNIDNYHFFTSYQIINHFLNLLSKKEKEEFADKLGKDTQIIWYEIISNLSPEKEFLNFNRGKIELEQAELIKALFVLQFKNDNNFERRTYQLNQFAEEWNQIETQLQDDNFWFFVTNDTSKKKEANRIDLLFDIVCNKPKKEEDKLYSYRLYVDKLTNVIKTDEEWKKIKKIFNLLLEWFKNRTIYHLLGLIIYLEIKTIADIYFEYINKLENKNEFENKLRTWLHDEINFDQANSKYNLSNLSYNTREEAKKILLIFNIASYQVSDFNYRFPFHKLKTQNWSLEHIHAQKSEMFEKIKEVKEWLKDIRVLVDELYESAEKDIIKERMSNIEEAINKMAEDEIIKSDIKNEVNILNDMLVNKLDLHDINNLCLLDSPTNSTISNSNFRDKRKKIIEIDNKGEVKNEQDEIIKTFIPLCTKNAFLKYYTQDSDNLQFSYWGHQDREDYISAVEMIVNNYLKPNADV